MKRVVIATHYRKITHMGKVSMYANSVLLRNNQGEL